MAARDGLMYALVERVEDIFGMNQRAMTITLAYQNTAVKAVVNAIPGLQHRAPTWKRSVVVNKL
jgi:hypothetical protein